jgi:low temperature requirement protein LtrA
MNFTWFASAFAIDDWLYRVTTFVQMGGALVLAAGAQPALDSLDFGLITRGYVLMRLASVAQWVRAAITSPGYRSVALRWAGGISGLQILWVVRLFWAPAGGTGLATFLVLVAGELAVPVWAQTARHIPWHPHHIAERYMLFTLIVLGESILAAANAIIDAARHSSALGNLWLLAACGLILAAGMWWTYTARPQHHHLATMRSAFIFGYFHYVIFAAAGAFSAGIEVLIAVQTGESHLPHVVAGSTVTVPVALFVLGIWWLTLRHTMVPWASVALCALVAVILAGPWLGPGVVVASGAMALIIVILEATDCTGPQEDCPLT